MKRATLLGRYAAALLALGALFLVALGQGGLEIGAGDVLRHWFLESDPEVARAGDLPASARLRRTGLTSRSRRW